MQNEKDLIDNIVIVNDKTGEVIQPADLNVSNKMEDLLKDDSNASKGNPLSGLSSLLDQQIFESQENSFNPKPYTTEIIESIKQLKPSLTVEQIQELVDYAQGGQRPEFMETMMTQTNDKLNEITKLMVILQLLRIPSLVDYQSTLRKNLMSPESIGKMTYEEMSKISANVQKEIADTLSLSLRTAQTLSSQSQVPTKVEKLANALMGVSDATREKIEELIKSEM